jgi:pyridoxine kinase
VQLSIRGGYGGALAPRGTRLAAAEAEALFGGLRAAGLLRSYSHVLSGYCSDASVLRVLAAAVREMREMRKREGGRDPPAKPSAEMPEFVLDPVLGDNGRLYVPAELVPVFRDELVPLATLLTPNQFEAETLSGVPIRDSASASAGLSALHALGARTVVITSTDRSARVRRRPRAGDRAPSGAGASPPPPDALAMIVSCPFADVSESELFAGGAGRGARGHAQFTVLLPRIDGEFSGTGDLTAALLLVERLRRPHDLVAAVESVCAVLLGVCARTLAHFRRCTEAARGEQPEPSLAAAASAASAAGCPSTQAFNELRLAESMKLVADPAAARVERVDIRAFLLEDLELGIEIGGGV